MPKQRKAAKVPRALRRGITAVPIPPPHAIPPHHHLTPSSTSSQANEKANEPEHVHGEQVVDEQDEQVRAPKRIS